MKLCGCGCGASVRREYLPGHFGRVHGRRQGGARMTKDEKVAFLDRITQLRNSGALAEEFMTADLLPWISVPDFTPQGKNIWIAKRLSTIKGHVLHGRYLTYRVKWSSEQHRPVGLWRLVEVSE